MKKSDLFFVPLSRIENPKEILRMLQKDLDNKDLKNASLKLSVLMEVLPETHRTYMPEAIKKGLKNVLRRITRLDPLAGMEAVCLVERTTNHNFKLEHDFNDAVAMKGLNIADRLTRTYPGASTLRAAWKTVDAVRDWHGGNVSQKAGSLTRRIGKMETKARISL